MRLAIALSIIALTACGQQASQDRNSTLSGGGWNRDPFPTLPELSETPGALCTTPDEYHYPEHIPYCNRSVSSSLKRKIIRIYDERFEYIIQQLPRSDFKIDHFIPLCMGGSNTEENLWPQHKSVYTITDPMEEKFCTLMDRAMLKQRDAVQQIVYAKQHLDEVPGILRHLDELLDR